jgi:hypothetical protein
VLAEDAGTEVTEGAVVSRDEPIMDTEEAEGTADAEDTAVVGSEGSFGFWIVNSGEALPESLIEPMTRRIRRSSDTGK